jgi:two-component system, LytTR family, sensor histidine kinase AlgZ
MEASAARMLAEDDGDTQTPAALALPREMILFAVAMPPVLYMMFDPRAFHNNTAQALQSLGGTTFYTLVCTVATHAAFLVVPARMCPRSSAVRIPMYLALLVLFVLAGTVLTIPILHRLCPTFDDPLRLSVKGLVISVLYAAVGVTTVYVRARLGRLQERTRAAREAALEARLRALTARTNPHFLFNSLNAGMSLIATDPERAEDHFARLSSLFRYALDGSSRRYVRLDEELASVRDYLEIESARFGERLRYALDLDQELNGALVPPMLVQPLVENAVVHGVTARREGGSVRVTARREGERFVVRVEDDGIGEGRSRHRGSGTALADLRERIEIVYGSNATLTTRPAGDFGGFVAELRLPFASS